MAPVRILLDSMIFDLLAEEPEALQLLYDLSVVEKIELLKTHIQEDQIAAIPDARKRHVLLDLFERLPGRRLPTSGMVLGVSRLGEARLGGGNNEIKFEDIRKANPRNAPDALLAMTASSEADIIVTNDRTLRKRIDAKGTALEALDFEEFLQRIHAF